MPAKIELNKSGWGGLETDDGVFNIFFLIFGVTGVSGCVGVNVITVWNSGSVWNAFGATTVVSSVTQVSTISGSIVELTSMMESTDIRSISCGGDVTVSISMICSVLGSGGQIIAFRWSLEVIRGKWLTAFNSIGCSMIMDSAGTETIDWVVDVADSNGCCWCSWLCLTSDGFCFDLLDEEEWFDDDLRCSSRCFDDLFDELRWWSLLLLPRCFSLLQECDDDDVEEWILWPLLLVLRLRCFGSTINFRISILPSSDFLSVSKTLSEWWSSLMIGESGNFNGFLGRPSWDRFSGVNSFFSPVMWSIVIGFGRIVCFSL